jgi:outer membrane protein assembly factor BamB
MRMNIALAIVAALSVGCLNASITRAAENNWPQFLGPGSHAVAANSDLPDRWSDTENVAWKTDIPGRGWSSPVGWGDRVFLTTVVEQPPRELPQKTPAKDAAKPPSDAAAQCRCKVLCLDLISGNVLWERTVYEGNLPGSIQAKNSYASETPTVDDQRVYAYFGNVGVYCLDFGGKLLWSKPIEPHKTQYNWGTASSPVLHGDRLYLLNDNKEKSCLLALDKRTGQQAWRVERDETASWATPLVWVNSQRTEIVTTAGQKICSYDLDGKRLWWLHGMTGNAVATPYADGGLLYVGTGYTREKAPTLYAIRPGAAGDISPIADKPHSPAIAWIKPAGASYIPTTLVYDGRLYVLYDLGKLSAYHAQTGEPLYQNQRLPKGRVFTASPWAFGGRVFCLNEDGVTFVVRAGDKFELLHTNRLPSDDMYLATPAAIGDRLLIRSSARIYCIRKSRS